MFFMTVSDQRRNAILDAMADHMLTKGLAASTLRSLARAAGTSDRMLIYYFTTKNALFVSVLEHLAGRLLQLLAQPDGGTPQSFAKLLAELWTAARGPALRPYMQLFVELAATGGRDVDPYTEARTKITATFLEWIAQRLVNTGNDSGRARAALLLATLDGLYLLDCAGHSDAAEQAASEIGRD